MLVACPGFGPIFAIVARNGAVFGIGGFESPQPISDEKQRQAQQEECLHPDAGILEALGKADRLTG